PNRPMHVAGLATYDAGPLKKADGGIEIDRIREYVNARMHLIPRYRQRLAYVPLENQPVWVDDDHFNIHYHVRHTALPRPGDHRQLTRLAARIMAQHLDRPKPPREMRAAEGLDGAANFALTAQVHHRTLDAMSGSDLVNVP